MPENTESEGQDRTGSGHGRSAMTINKELQANKSRIGSAKYYDIASALMGKGKADLEELFLNAARVSSQNLLHINLYGSRTLKVIGLVLS
jgi:hypothetical protein